MRCLIFICLFSSLAFAQENPPEASPAPPPSAPQAAPPVPQAAPVVQPAGFYYYCDRAKAYYPTVSTCAEGWIAIPIGSPPPVIERQWPDSVGLETEETVRTRPTAVSLELFGRALLYSLNIDHAISSHFAIGAGISYWKESDWWRDYNASITVVPVYANYYFTEKPRRGFLTAGANWISVTSSGRNDNTFENSGVAGVLGGGYEYHDATGFLLRLGGYLIIGRSVDANPAVSLGYAF